MFVWFVWFVDRLFLPPCAALLPLRDPMEAFVWILGTDGRV